jgi:aldose 1-epimerase
MAMNPNDPHHLRGYLPDGRRIRSYPLVSGDISASILDLGAGVQAVHPLGEARSVTLGSPDAAAYGRIMQNFGTVVGPVANRIRGAAFELKGRTYALDANQNGRHSLHSGSAGTHLKTWTVLHHEATTITLALDLPDGDGGFPGNRRITSTYRLEGAALIHELKAETDAPTLMNPALHAYWNMQPPEEGWAGQRLTIHADRYLPVDGDVLPTGEVADVAGTPFDFREARTLDPAGMPDLDHNFCLADAPRPLSPALRLESDVSGLAMTIETTAPGLQVFGMHPFSVEGDETLHGTAYPRRAALAIEPQCWPDAPGREAWPGIVLMPGQTFRQTNRYAFERLSPRKR